MSKKNITGDTNTVFADVRISEMDTGESFICRCADEAKDKIQQQVWSLCVERKEVITMGCTVGEPLFSR